MAPVRSHKAKRSGAGDAEEIMPKRKKSSTPRQKMSSRLLNKAQTLQEYINACLISDDDPGLLFSWFAAVVEQFVQNANALAIGQPPWITTAPGNMTSDSLQQNIVAHLRFVGGGSFGVAVVAPNDLVQFGHVIERLVRIEMHPFMQAAFAPLPAGSVLAATAILHDRTNVAGTARARVPPLAPARLLFG